MTTASWIGFAEAVGALLLASLVTRFAVGRRRLQALWPLAAGYALGEGGAGWLSLEAIGPALPFALAIGAGWAAIEAAGAAVATFRRAPRRSAVLWAVGFALLGPSCLAGGLSPVVVSVLGPEGLSLPFLAVVVAAAIVPDASSFRAMVGASSLPSHKSREAIRTGDAFQACALLAWPAYWAVTRALATPEGVTTDTLVASVGVSFGMGIGLGIAGMFLLRLLTANLAVLALLLAVVLASSALSSILTVSSVATCFIAAILMAQEGRKRDAVFAIAKNVSRPFRLLFLVAAGAAAPGWRGAAAPALIFLVVLCGRFLLGLAADSIASVVPGPGAGRHFAWAAAIPSALSAAMVGEAALLLGARGASLAEIVPEAAAGAARANLLGWNAGSLSPVAPFLLATGVGEIAATWALRRRLEPGGRTW